MHPIAIRTGERLFDGGQTIPLRLLTSRAFKTGVLHLVYARDDVERTGSYEDAKAHLPQEQRARAWSST
ncbi:MAG: hypothetical protein QOI25_5114 [Mycobacterium sp.]|nr:hypothetical protein [Mycobacterium sp.]